VPNTNPIGAREAYITSSLDSDEQVKVLLRSEKTGPFEEDHDWVIALACAKAAERIEAAVAQNIAQNTQNTQDTSQFSAALARIEEVAKSSARTEAAIARLEIASKQAQGGEKEEKRSPGPSVVYVNSVSGVFAAFAVSLASFVGVAEFLTRYPADHLQPVLLYAAGTVIGLSVAAFWAKYASYWIRQDPRRRR
jgi:hypothetical protein